MASTGYRVVGQIREQILRGEWGPGVRLQPVAMAAVLGTSSTVVREALARLAGDGLVTTKPNRGFFVRDLNLQELSDLTELRCVTEGLAARLALSRGDVAWESELIAVHHRLARIPRRSAEDPGHVDAAWQKAHKAFHLKLLEACACQPMLKLASDLSDSTELYRCWAAPHVEPGSRDVEGEHRAILNAALGRHADELVRLLREHYETTVRVVLDSGIAEESAGS
ncbi:GntR family transcriptional regulator [Arthrobacter sp. zg-Y859]|uniref:GntR family transcriptional regulator n=1 Tax=Arthrobacter jinronghuae TaxID=2964609 RepID=A0ABT1NMD1_9MICC|nr:GntR family transcriptional regulator [Arthrobacter jinronghuae]MCQ1948877.1 GntR family transcriptional regulator [Arthrobacter jinronghuae]UWX78317.1 GntR family transcriptional regulator [Arthrobacter jinronghuae]